MMMGGAGHGPANGRMFGGLNNISANLMKGLGQLGGQAGGKGNGLGGLGSLLGGGGLGGLGGILGGLGGGNGGLGGILGGLGGGNGGLGGLANMAGLFNLGGMAGGAGSGTPDLARILSSMGGAGLGGAGLGGAGLGGLDIASLMGQLGNMQAKAPPTPPPASNSSAPAMADNANEPIHEAQFAPVEDGANTAEEFGQRFAGASGTAPGGEGRAQAADAGNAELNNALWQILSAYLQNQAQQQQQRPPAANSSGAWRQEGYSDYAQPEPAYSNYYAEPVATYAPAPDICFDCPLNCPRAGLKLPLYEDVRRQAQDWRRY